MRCKACNSLDAVWDGHDYYCEECMEVSDDSLSELEELEEYDCFKEG